MNHRYLTDLETGLKTEIALFTFIQSNFGCDLVRTTNPFAVFDFHSATTLVELKCRSNTYRKYPTTLIGANKIAVAKQSGKAAFFVFQFKDGIYYWKFNEAELESFSIAEGGRCDRGSLEMNRYVYIPIENLLGPLLKS